MINEGKKQEREKNHSQKSKRQLGLQEAIKIANTDDFKRIGLLDWLLAIPQPDLDDLAIMPTVTERLAALMALEESKLQVEGEDQDGYRKEESDQNSQPDNGLVDNDAIEQPISETMPMFYETENTFLESAPDHATSRSNRPAS